MDKLMKTYKVLVNGAIYKRGLSAMDAACIAYVRPQSAFTRFIQRIDIIEETFIERIKNEIHNRLRIHLY